MTKETKTGQSIDSVKESLLSPILVDKILEYPTLKETKRLSAIDVGTGNASYSRYVINRLLQRGVRIKNLGLLDADTQIFPDLLTTTLEPEMSSAINVQVVETKSRFNVGEFLTHYKEQYDVGISQLVLHQILKDSAMLHLMYTTSQTLKPDGRLFVIDLHPKFVKYLMQHEPEKINGREVDGVIEGEYHFDSGGSVAMKSRETAYVLGTILGLGFDCVNAEPITPEVIADKKSRYQDMVAKQIPMFYIMQFKKNERNFISSTEGVVKLTQSYQENGLLVVFADKEEILIPRFKGSEEIMPDDYLSLLEIHRPENDMRVLNYWTQSRGSQKEVNEIRGGQITFSVT